MSELYPCRVKVYFYCYKYPFFVLVILNMFLSNITKQNCIYIQYLMCDYDDWISILLYPLIDGVLLCQTQKQAAFAVR